MTLGGGERGTARRLGRDGFAVIGRFLDLELVTRVRGEVDCALAAPPVPGCERPHNRLVPLRWNDAAVDSILDDPGRRERIAASCDAQDLRWISGYVSVKEPRTPALWWHQDWWCWDHPVSLRPAAAQIALLVYLTGASERTGALRVLPHTHRASVPLHALLPRAHARGVALEPEHPALGDHPGQVTLRVDAGDAVVLDYRLLHGTHPNDSARRRDCVLLSFAPAWRDLPPHIRAHLIQHTALPGDDDDPADRPWCAELLPRFAGARRDLALSRRAPARFAVAG